MDLLRGGKAIDAAKSLLDGSKIVAVAVDPKARTASPAAIVALGNKDTALLIDPSTTPKLGELLQSRSNEVTLTAFEAKAVHQALVRTFGVGPHRWACIHLTAMLIAAGEHVDLTLPKIAERFGTTPPADLEGGFDAIGEHVRDLCQLIEAMIPALRENRLTWVSRIESACIPAIAEMELCGMPFDAQRWKELATEAEKEKHQIATELHKIFSSVGDPDLFGGTSINFDAEAEVRRGLHALGHRVPDTRRATLETLPAPVGPTLVRYREVSKIASAYGEAFLEHVGPDGRIHPSFEQIGASTGRMACHSPNLQAVVKGGPHRDCFHTDEGRKLVVGDYAACELRILAEMSGDPVFAEAFARGEDLHARVASEMFGKPVSKTENPELRGRAKAINFGLAYGMGAAGLARTIGQDVYKARELLEQYFQKFPKIGRHLEGSARHALERGYAVTLAGRRLKLDLGTTRDSRAQAERIAKNMPIQGTNADITKIALARLRHALAEFEQAWIVNTVHDEIVVECQSADATAVLETLESEMRQGAEEVLKKIPVVVDAAISDTWNK